MKPEPYSVPTPFAAMQRSTEPTPTTRLKDSIHV